MYWCAAVGLVRKTAPILKQKEYLNQEFHALIKADESIFDFTEESALNGICYRDLQQPENEWINPRLRATLGYDSGEELTTRVRWQDIIHPDDALRTVEKGAEQPL